MLARVLIPVVLVLAAVASAQVSFEEAQRRLRDKLTTRPSATQPVSEVDRLRMENRRLRDENAELSHEVAQLREALAAGATTNPATSRPTALSGPAAQLAGRWQGGVLRDGNAFITEFAIDGTYHQSWLTSSHQESGHWTMPSDNVVEMWTAPNGDNQKRNRWHITFDKDQVTLIPMAPDDTDLPGAKPLVLRHAP